MIFYEWNVNLRKDILLILRIAVVTADNLTYSNQNLDTIVLIKNQNKIIFASVQSLNFN